MEGEVVLPANGAQGEEKSPPEDTSIAFDSFSKTPRFICREYRLVQRRVLVVMAGGYVLYLFFCHCVFL